MKHIILFLLKLIAAFLISIAVGYAGMTVGLKLFGNKEDSVVDTLSHVQPIIEIDCDSIDNYKDSLRTVVSQKPVEKDDTIQPSKTPAKEAKKIDSDGLRSIGNYAVWTGSTKKGKPHGNGKMTFNEAHSIDNQRMAQAGDYIENAYYEDGELIYGTWCHQDGSIVEQIDK